MPTEGDQLLAFIRQAVVDLRVPPAHQPMVVEATARTVIAVLTNPAYLGQLAIVRELQTENANLRQYLAQQQMFLQRMQTVSPMKPPARPRKRSPKKAPAVTKNPPIRVKGSTAANRRAFKQGTGR